ncbi:MAG TPA: GNAT family N-acetyltransferase [Candidatus Saccharimonadia bacterium]|nr:GNAT family N-acetyltransferase [Candidatus Saccharimonadia bacterium]
MEIRIATTPEEKEEIYHLRYQAYVEELGWKFDEADDANKRLQDPEDDHETVYYVMDGEKMVATCRQHFGAGRLDQKTRDKYALDKFSEFKDEEFGFTYRLVVLPEYRGTTVLMRLLLRVYEDVWKKGIRFSFCYCRPRLIGVYERLGFIRYKENFLVEDQGYMAPMVLIVDDAKHLTAVRSPFLRTCRSNMPGVENSAWFSRTFPGMRECIELQFVDPEEFLKQWEEALSGPTMTLLQGLTQEQIQRLIAEGAVMSVKAGDTLLREGEAGHEMFLVLSGMARFIIATPDGSTAFLGTASTGEVFGEISLVARTPRSATVQAVTHLEVLIITQDFIRRAMKAYPDISITMLYNLTVLLGLRLKNTTDRLKGAIQESSKLAKALATQSKPKSERPLLTPDELIEANQVTIQHVRRPGAGA